MKQINMAVFKPENVEDFYEIGEVLGRYEWLIVYKLYQYQVVLTTMQSLGIWTFTDFVVVFLLYSSTLDLK